MIESVVSLNWFLFVVWLQFLFWSHKMLRGCQLGTPKQGDFMTLLYPSKGATRITSCGW